ncbi:hypothetical protein [uncultured Ruthenibacterium sp.]|uniref:hypothetical protein n=1 Tax=uncultured Ruthenibacterium sp. TaxID=1905347 RepID=UPI00349E9AE9
MAFFDCAHQEQIKDFSRMWAKLDELEELAAKHHIQDIAQDNNLKLLQTLVLFDLTNQPGREGSDAIDRYGHDWELKTLNINLTHSFSTNHHTNLSRIALFRQERWMFSSYKGIQLQEVYVVNPRDLEKYFSEWERKILKKIEKKTENPHMNNPKISLSYVKAVGVKVYPVATPLDPAEVLKVL